MTHCLNCNSSIDLNEKYCACCGQKTKVSVLSIGSIVKDFFSNLFNVENKIWHTLKDIWIPAKLSLAYIEGKRAQYYNPIRIFLIVLFTLFTVILIRINEGVDSLNEITLEQKQKVWEENMVARYDSLVQNSFIIEDSVGLKTSLFSELFYEESEDEEEELDEEKAEELFQIIESSGIVDDELIEMIRDSLREEQNRNINITFTKDGLKSNRRKEILFDKVPTSDLYNLSTEELQKKHGKGKRYYELALERAQKVAKDFSGSIKFLIGNGTWAIIAMILFLASVFKLLYTRHNFLYAEHFIFHLYGHTRMLLILLAIVLLTTLIENEAFNSTLTWTWFISGIIYLYIGMKRFYRQKGKKMKLKYLFTLLFAYPLIIILCLLLITLLSFVFI